MCDRIKVGPAVCWTLGEFRPLMPKGLIYGPLYADRGPEIGGEICLCPVDVPATAALNGYRSRWQARTPEWTLRLRSRRRRPGKSRPAG